MSFEKAQKTSTMGAKCSKQLKKIKCFGLKDQKSKKMPTSLASTKIRKGIQ